MWNTDPLFRQLEVTWIYIISWNEEMEILEINYGNEVILFCTGILIRLC